MNPQFPAPAHHWVKFYGWRVVAVAFLAHFLTVGTNFYIFNFLMEPLEAQRGWGRAELNQMLTLSTIIGFMGGLLFGTVVMRTGPRLLMTLAALGAGATFASLSLIHSFKVFCAAYMLLYLFNSALGGIVANTAVNNWFVMKRGVAIGLAMVGVSLCGAVIPPVAHLIYSRWSLEAVFLVIGGFILLLAPISWLMIRDSPEKYGLLPDGAPQPAGAPQIENPRPVEVKIWSFRRLIREPAFWRIGIGYGLVMIGVVGVMSQLKPRFRDAGFSNELALLMSSLAPLLGAMGKYFWGLLCDRFEPRRVAATLIGLNALGLAASFLTGSMAAQVFFIVCFGFGMGGANSTYPVMIAHVFGRESFAAVARFGSFMVAMQLLGYVIIRKSLLLTNSYDGAYFVFAVLDVIACLLILTTRNPKGI